MLDFKVGQLGGSGGAHARGTVTAGDGGRGGGWAGGDIKHNMDMSGCSERGAAGVGDTGGGGDDYIEIFETPPKTPAKQQPAPQPALAMSLTSAPLPQASIASASQNFTTPSKGTSPTKGGIKRSVEKEESDEEESAEEEVKSEEVSQLLQCVSCCLQLAFSFLALHYRLAPPCTWVHNATQLHSCAQYMDCAHYSRPVAGAVGWVLPRLVNAFCALFMFEPARVRGSLRPACSGP